MRRGDAKHRRVRTERQEPTDLEARGLCPRAFTAKRRA